VGGGVRDPFAHRRAFLRLRGVGAGVRVNLGVASVAHSRVCADTHTPSGPTPETRLQLGERGAAGVCPGVAGPPPSSAQPAQAASSPPGSR